MQWLFCGFPSRLTGDDRLRYLRPGLNSPQSSPPPPCVIVASFRLEQEKVEPAVVEGGERGGVSFFFHFRHILSFPFMLLFWPLCRLLESMVVNQSYSLPALPLDQYGFNKITSASISSYSQFCCLIGPKLLTLNLLSSCVITWSVVIRLEMRTLVEAPKDGVKMDV